MSVILGLKAYNHDSTAGFFRDGKLVYAAEEERFNRSKHTTGFPHHAIADGMRALEITSKDIDHVAFYWDLSAGVAKRIGQTIKWFPESLSNAPHLFKQWLRFRTVERHFRTLFGYDGPWHWVNHYLSHAAGVFFVSPFDESAILVLDGNGEIATSWVGVGRGNKIEKAYEIHYPHSLGLLWCSVTEYLGYYHNSDEGKVMALGAMGTDKYLQKFRQILKMENGRFKADLAYFDYHKTRRNWYSPYFERTFGPARKGDGELEQHHLDVATAVQMLTEEIVAAMAAHALKITGQKRLCYTGGVALNCVANRKLFDVPGLDELYINPPAFDPGAGLGSGLYVAHQILGEPRNTLMDRADFGPEYSDLLIEGALTDAGLKYEKPDDIAVATAELLAQGKVVGWFQGKMEIGPRALGFRSILADPTRAEMKDHINDKVKHREPYRPYGPMVPFEKAEQYFETGGRHLPFMLIAVPVREDARAKIPAVPHVDGTARVQTVRESENPLVHRLLNEFEKRSGAPVLINTSFNQAGEPIVCTPQDAIGCYLATKIDALVIGGFVTAKS
jgi:carbamoyltransferase